MRLWTCVLLVAGCSSSNAPNLPVGGGGGGDAGPDSSFNAIDARGDAAGSTIDASNVLHGRVCLAADPRKLVEAVDPAACASTGADGLTVQLKDRMATTNADGTFTIGAPAQTAGLLWKVSGANIVTSYMVIGDFEIPALTIATYTALRTSNNVASSPGEAAIMVVSIQNGRGLSGATATSSPGVGDNGAMYDGSSATGVWPRTATGAFGATWIPNIDVGNTTTSVSVTTAGTAPITVTSAPQPLFDGAITFTSLVFP